MTLAGKVLAAKRDNTPPPQLGVPAVGDGSTAAGLEIVAKVETFGKLRAKGANLDAALSACGLSEEILSAVGYDHDGKPLTTGRQA